MEKRRHARSVATGFVEMFMPTQRHTDREMPVRYNSPKCGAKSGRKAAGKKRKLT